MESGGNSNNISWTTNPLVFVMYILGILLLRFALGLAAIPLFTDQDQDAHVAWTATHVVHAFITFMAFHIAVTVPGVDDTTKAKTPISFWDSIDDGRLWSTARRALTTVPVVLFLLTCEFTNFKLGHFFVNLMALVLFEAGPKVPFMQRVFAGLAGRT